MQAQHVLTRAEYERELDAAIAGSFPASDPPPWTLGASSWMELHSVPVRIPVPAAVDVVFDGGRFASSRLARFGEAMAMTALVPLGIVIAGLPVVALFWGVAKAVSWITGNS